MGIVEIYQEEGTNPHSVGKIGKCRPDKAGQEGRKRGKGGKQQGPFRMRSDKRVGVKLKKNLETIQWVQLCKLPKEGGGKNKDHGTAEGGEMYWGQKVNLVKIPPGTKALFVEP